MDFFYCPVSLFSLHLPIYWSPFWCDVRTYNRFGFYDTQYKDRSAPDCRGRLRSDKDGSFAYRAVVPVAYPIPGDVCIYSSFLPIDFAFVSHRLPKNHLLFSYQPNLSRALSGNYSWSLIGTTCVQTTSTWCSLNLDSILSQRRYTLGTIFSSTVTLFSVWSRV